MDESAKQVIDLMSLGTMLGAIGAILPPISALFTIIWVGIRIWETDTIKEITGRHQKRDEKGRFIKDDD